MFESLQKIDDAKLILENGAVFNGKVFGHAEASVGEVVFTTGMTGYQETMTDPSFAGQIVTMTYPLIGNYGINLEDMESKKPMLKGLVVREKCDTPSNWRCEMDLDGFMKQNKIIGIEGIDTRELTRVIRNNGTMKGVILTNKSNCSQNDIEAMFNNYDNTNIVEEVTTTKNYVIESAFSKEKLHLAVIDFGIKAGILRELNKRGCKLSVFKASASFEEIMKVNPDAVFLSNGPGDPENVPQAIELVKQLKGKMPIIGICLGHQIIALAMGCKIRRMKFGHHGANQPVKDLLTNRVYITSQNHEYVVQKLVDEIEVTFINTNEDSIEGIKHKTLPIWSVQFHPEASPGPLDSGFLFDRIMKIAKNNID